MVTDRSTKDIKCILPWDPVWLQLDPELTRKSQNRSWCYNRVFASNKDTEVLTFNQGRVCVLKEFSNSKNNCEQEMECSPYLLVDIIIPAEVSSPPWKNMNMNVLKTQNKTMVIIKLLTFFSGLSALFSTHTSNHAWAPTALFSEENTLTCSITVSQLFTEYKRWKTQKAALLYYMSFRVKTSRAWKFRGSVELFIVVSQRLI